MTEKQSVSFTVIGRVSGHHRADRFYDRKKKVMRAFRNKEYDNSRKVIQLAAKVAACGYNQPELHTTTRVYLHFLVGTHTLIKRKDGKQYWKGRSVCDADNICKAILDALQGIFFKNDKDAVALPFIENLTNDNPYITRFDNRDGNQQDWTEVRVESIPAEQMTLEPR